METFFLQGRCLTCEGRDDAVEFADIRSAMMVLMFAHDEIWEVFRILSALLHLGNTKYKGKLTVVRPNLIESVSVKQKNWIKLNKIKLNFKFKSRIRLQLHKIARFIRPTISVIVL